ncbi:ATPase, partial [Escherichia coli]|nr:ATPase [Escherichia coli]
GELANYNIRSTLLLSKRIITSPAIKIEDLIKSYISGELPSINFTRFMDALIRGDYEVYKNGDIPEIYPIFQVDSQVRQSPLQALRILTLLNSIQVPGKSIEDKHLSVQSISSYFDALGATELAVDKALESLIMAKLIEPYDMSSTTLSSNQKLAISYKGRAHLKLASRNSVYFYQMALTTAITDSSIANKIKDTYASKGNHISKMYNIRNLFLEYLISEDSVYISNEITHEKYECQKELINRLLVFKQNRYDESEPPENTLGDIYKLGIVKKHARAIVDSYDVERGLGYLIVNDIDGPIDISQNLLKQYNIDSVVDGDTLMCDISRTEIGMVISHIYSKESPNVEAISGECIIKRYFPQRGYGFCSCDKLPVDIFFHVTIFSSESRQYLREGLIFKGEIIPSHNDSFQVRKVIHS